MTRTEWDWLLGKPSDETMLVIDDGVLAMLDEYVKKQSDAAFARGVAAMREAAVAVASKRADLPKHSDLDSAWCRSAECIRDELRHLLVPEDKS